MSFRPDKGEICFIPNMQISPAVEMTNVFCRIFHPRSWGLNPQLRDGLGLDNNQILSEDAPVYCVYLCSLNIRRILAPFLQPRSSSMNPSAPSKPEHFAVPIIFCLFLSLGLWNWNIEQRASRDRLETASSLSAHQSAIGKMKAEVSGLAEQKIQQQRMINSLNAELTDVRSAAAKYAAVITALSTRFDHTSHDVDRLAGADANNTEWLNEIDMELDIFRPRVMAFDSLRNALAAADSALSIRQKQTDARVNALITVSQHRRWWPW